MLFPIADKFKAVMPHSQGNAFIMVDMSVNRDVDRSRTVSFSDLATKTAAMLSLPSYVPDPLHPVISKYSKLDSPSVKMFSKSVYPNQLPLMEHHGMLNRFVPMVMMLLINV